jgi:hypothetical protein
MPWSVYETLPRRIRARLRRAAAPAVEWLRDEDGLEAVEWVLVLGGIIVPMIGMIMYVERAVVFYYQCTSWIVSLPFP